MDTILAAYKEANVRYESLVRDFKKVLQKELDAKDKDEDLIDVYETRVAGYMERAGEALYRTCAYLSRGGEASPETLRLFHGDKNWTKYNPLPRIDEFVEKYPEHYRAPEALFMKAQQQSSNQRFVDSVKTLVNLQEQYSKSPWSKSAATMKQEIERPRLSVHSSLNGVVGKETKLSARIRNIKELKVEIYKFDIAKYIENSGYLDSVHKQLGYVYTLLNQITDKDRAL